MDKADNNEIIDKLFPDKLTIRDEANALICESLRNGPIENIHSDGSRITQEEIKEIMIFASEKLYDLLKLKEQDSAAYFNFIKFMRKTYCKNWQR